MSVRPIADDTIGGMDRLDLIAARTKALDLELKPRTCAYCTLYYRHTAGVRRRDLWFCSRACWARGRSQRGRDTALLLRAIDTDPKPSGGETLAEAARKAREALTDRERQILDKRFNRDLS